MTTITAQTLTLALRSSRTRISHYHPSTHTTNGVHHGSSGGGLTLVLVVAFLAAAVALGMFFWRRARAGVSSNPI